MSSGDSVLIQNRFDDSREQRKTINTQHMNKTPPDSRPGHDTISQQYDFLPYPEIPVETPVSDRYAALYSHNLVTAYYRRDQHVVESDGRTILDAGCGSGQTTLLLAEANPGAKITGIDISEKSLVQARKRLVSHGFTDVEFRILPIERAGELQQEFDYINCEEVLYLLPDPAEGLRALKSSLKPDGILRANLHCKFQRQKFFMAQQLGETLGLLHGENQSHQVNAFRMLMKSLKDNSSLKSDCWNNEYESNTQNILSNHLIRGDKGSTIPELFRSLDSAGLEFISMVDWQSWDLEDLFKTRDDLPDEVRVILDGENEQQKLYLFQLLAYNHRLLDFWCCRPQKKTQSSRSVNSWKMENWLTSSVHLHPQARQTSIKTDLIASILTLRPFDFHSKLPLRGGSAILDSVLQSVLLPLWDSPMSFTELVARWLQIRPVSPLTLKPTDKQEAFLSVKRLVQTLETKGYLMVVPRSD